MPKESGWAIVGNHGLYVDWRPSRVSAIAQHVHDCCRIDEERPSEFTTGRSLDPLQKERWQRCRSNGDRAVKVTISW